MSDLDVFRQDFAGLMQRCAAERRHKARDHGGPTGEDLRITALFERLADQAEAIEAEAHRSFVTRCGSGSLRAFFSRRDESLEAVGVLYWPKTVSDLLGWLSCHARCERDLVTLSSS